jgi:hypothetical protein
VGTPTHPPYTHGTGTFWIECRCECVPAVQMQSG